jgi:divalent metal cation (Fe/Co/Zn/Cd) transporter
MNAVSPLERSALARRGRNLEYFTIGWNAVEGLVAVVSGFAAGSVSLVGFGIDSFIEVVSGTAILWRIAVDANEVDRQRNEKRALRIVGICFLLLAIYVGYESASDLWFKRAPEHSVPGIVLSCASLVVMPLLSRAKRNVGYRLGSAAMQADAKQSELCAYLSAILLSGLVLNALFGFWWADPGAAVVMTPIIAREGIESMKGRLCEECSSIHTFPSG